MAELNHYLILSAVLFTIGAAGVLLRRNLDHARMTSRKLSLELQQFVHLYTPEANELRRRITKYMVMERMIEREMARRHTY